MKKKIEVVAAIIVHENRILCVQRGRNKLSYISEKFEFPGGKIEENESRIDALKRELLEELDMSPIVKELFLTVEHEYPDFVITMHSYICESSSKNLHLTEHIAAEWLLKEELVRLDWAAADIPIVKKLVSNERIYC
jgi:8-oxo-dGTP diphosphatase